MNSSLSRVSVKGGIAVNSNYDAEKGYININALVKAKEIAEFRIGALLERNYILNPKLLVVGSQLIVAVGENQQLVAHHQLGTALRYEVVAIATHHYDKRIVGQRHLI